MSIELLNEEERGQLPMVISRRNRFKRLIKTSVLNYKTLFSNCLMITGRPGSGKTTLVVGYLEQLRDQGLIAGYTRASGHVTPSALYGLLRDTAAPDEGLPQVLVLDDVDCMKDEGCLELLKAAFDTKSNLSTNRDVHYQAEGRKSTFKYGGFGIIITNDNFLETANSVHLEAVVDRVQYVSCDLQPMDMQIFTTSLIEKYLNDNEDGLDDSTINAVVELFNTDIRKWMKKDSFRKAKVPYSLRLVKKFIDAQKAYGNDWKDFNLSYSRLEAAAETSDLATAFDPANPKADVDLADIPEPVVRNVRVVKHGLPPVNSNGKYFDPNTGIEYSSSMQCYYRKKASSTAA